MSSPPPPPSTSEAYETLTSILHPPPTADTSVLEIDILPSTYPPQVLYEHPALAFPKSLLVKLYLHARSLFVNSQCNSDRSDVDNDNDSNPESTHTARLKATTILLLFDPNHLTAINLRKRYILSLRNASSETLAHALNRELTLLTTFFTSPLTKHAKSSTLWAHRLWLFRNHYDDLVASPSAATPSSSDPQTANFWNEELGIILKAAQRHPRNYYAWEYARQLFRLLDSTITPSLFVETIGDVHNWCLLHPRDISGWAFLLFLIRSTQPTRAVRGGNGEGDEGRMLVGAERREEVRDRERKEIERVVWETEEWVRKYEWRGESVGWFLKWLKEEKKDGDGAGY